MRLPLTRWIMASAACLTVVVLWLFVPGPQSTAQAFNRFATALVDARSATFQMEVKIEGQGKQNVESSYLAPGRMRVESPGIISVMDFKAGKSMTLEPKRKVATIMTMRNMPPEGGKPVFNDVFERTRDLLSKTKQAKEEDFTRLGEKEIDGRHAIGFRFASAVQSLTLWGDPATGLPVLVEVVWSGIPRTETTMSHFELNKDLKPAMFSVNPPDDYKVNEFDVDVSDPTETTFVDAMRLAVEVNGGVFLDNLDTASTQAVIIKQALRDIKGKKQDISNEMMQLAMTVGRGMMFALQLPESADAHYAGKGGKLGEGDRPIFWYKPAGAEKYRVIYADLTAKEADRAPEVAEAVRLVKTKPSAEK